MKTKRQKTFVMKKSVFLFPILLVLLSACGAPRPSVSVSTSPAYPCRGEDVTFYYELSNIDRIEVIDNNGIVLHQGSNRNGNFVIPNITESMLPLKAKGWVGDESRTKTIGPRSSDDFILRIIDDETETETYELTTKITNTTSEETGAQECCSWTYAGMDENCEQWYPVLAIYETLKGKSDIIPPASFSGRARVVKIHNKSDYELVIKRSGRSYTVDPRRTIDISSHDVRPGGMWIAEFVEPLDYFVGYWVDVPKIETRCTAGFISIPIRPDRQIEIAFTLICDI